MLAFRQLSKQQWSAWHLRPCSIRIVSQPQGLALSRARFWHLDGAEAQLPWRRLISSQSSLAPAVSNDSTLHPPPPSPSADQIAFAKSLPVVCPGCGAFSQTVDPDSPGYYSLKGSAKRAKEREREQNEERINREAMARLQGEDTGHGKLLISRSSTSDKTSMESAPLCSRCHYLIYQSKGQSIVHPSMRSIRDMIEASPHKHNHIYHVLDAADFPMSLIPNLTSALNLPNLRTQNRRSRIHKYVRGRTAEVSFIITRSDLLAPLKEQVDRMKPYLQDVLRDALRHSGKNVRLGNLRCVSAKRGWWTPVVKQEIWNRGGAGWVVGKVNVGKSALFEAVYPKGRTHDADAEARLKAIRRAGQENNRALSAASLEDNVVLEQHSLIESLELEHASNATKLQDAAISQPSTNQESAASSDVSNPTSSTPEDDQQLGEDDIFDEEDVQLLPPPQPETNYPRMPIISSLPGTTASPIRIPYGGGKGELIDLPGVERSALETYVKAEHRKSLIMHHRIVPKQYTIKAGQSLLIGGIIRIEPKTDDVVFLAYPFTPLEAHRTRTEKAIAIQTGFDVNGDPDKSNVQNITTETAKGQMQSAGIFILKWDATKQRTGSLTHKAAGKRSVPELPFTVYSADILIEGVGWVELACQIRNRSKIPQGDALSGETDDPPPDDFLPRVEIFSPMGKFVDIRRPMNAWITGGPKQVPKHAQRARPRMSISMHRRREGGKLGAQKTHTDTS